MTNNDDSCDPEPGILGFVAEDGWAVAVFMSSRVTGAIKGWEIWATKPGADGLDMFGIGTEDSCH